MKCYPSKCFPLKPPEKLPPRMDLRYRDEKRFSDEQYKKYKKWDSWYVWRYLLAPRMDEEEKYSIGSEWKRSHISNL